MKEINEIKINQTFSGLYDLEIKGEGNVLLERRRNIKFKTAIKILKKYSYEEEKL